MVEVTIGFFSDYLLGKFAELLDNKFFDFKSKKEEQAFYCSLKEWISEFIFKNETTIVNKPIFTQYFKHHDLIQHIWDYLLNTTDKQTENEFQTQECEKIYKYISKNNIPCLSTDKKVIEAFIREIFIKIKAVFYSKLPSDMTPILHTISQIQPNSNLIIQEAPKKTITKKDYPKISDIIKRKVIPFKHIQESNIYFHMDEIIDLYEACQKENHVVLLGEAGCGKTTILKHLAHCACSDYHTLLISLSDYSGEDIEYLIQKTYSDYESLSMFLIFDAFDEIGENERNNFARKLNSFIKYYPKIIVLVSVRNNFYKFSNNEGKGSTFLDFKEYGLCPLSDNDIKEYSEINEIDFQKFKMELYNNGLRELAYNPFYLSNLVRLMKKYSHLPVKKELMNELIKISFNFDKIKFANPDIVSDSEYELNQLLEKVAFAMQCKEDKVHINTMDYQTLFNKEDRTLLSYSSLFVKNDNEEWHFEHNNFREYLAAKYLNRLKFEKIKEVLCYDSDRTKIRESWINVISYLVLIYENNELFEWMKDISDSLLIKFEISRVDVLERSKIFIKIFNSYTSRNMWISRSKNTVEELVYFGESEDTLDFLIKTIQNPQHYWALSNALHLLNHFNNLYNKNQKIRDVLFNCILSSETREYEKETAISILANLGLQTSEITTTLINMLESEKSEYLHNGIIYYLTSCNLYEEYIDVLLQELDFSNKNDQIYKWKIENSFLQIQGKSAIQKVLEYYCSKEYHHSDKKEIFQHLIDRSIFFYQNGDDTIFDMVFNAVILLYKNYNTNLVDTCKYFWVQTNTTIKAFDMAVEIYIKGSENEHAIFEFLLCIADDACIEKLIESYKNNPPVYVDLFRRLTINLESNNKYFSTCIELLKKNGTIISFPENQIDYNEIRKKGKQIYFNALFEKEKYQELINKLVSIIGDPHITYDKVKDKFCEISNYGTIDHMTLMPVIWDICECNFEDQQILNFTSHVRNWNWFAISNIYSCLSSRNNDIKITESQKNYIQEFCDKAIEVIDISSEISDNDKNGITYSWRLTYFCFFVNYFDIKYPKEIICKLTAIPKYLFDGNCSDTQIFSDYILKQLTEDELYECIINNIKTPTLCLHSKLKHIKYCKDHQIPDALQLAEQICTTPKIDMYDKKNALEYIDTIMGDCQNGYEYIYSKFLSTDDEKLLDAIIEITLPIKSFRLISRLEEVNARSEDKEKYLIPLIKLQSEFGLNRYYEISKEKMTIPDYNNYSHSGVTNAISKIDSLELLPTLIKLQNLLFTDGFVDYPDFGLYENLSRALFNISKEHAVEVVQALKNCLQKNNINPREKSFCNFVVDDIESNYSYCRDTPWSIQCIKRFLIDNDY